MAKKNSKRILSRSHTPVKNSKPSSPNPTPKPSPNPSQPKLTPRDLVLKKLNLKPSDILAEAKRDRQLIFVTKNGMKVRARIE